jgi:tripartite ATP-independent transporter DctP family solute receptor
MIPNRKILLPFFILLLFHGCSSQNDGDPKTIILAHAMHLTHPVSVAMEHMADFVDEYSGGQMKIEIYPTGQLGGERELLELIQIGTIGMTKVSAGSLENIVPDMRVFSLPYLFRDEDHMANVLWGEVGEELLDTGTEYRLKGIAYYDAGSRSFYSVDRPIHTPDDLSGMKIRVMPSTMATMLIRTYGASPTPLAYGELYTAFQGGIVDAAENNPPSFYTSRHYEVCNYYILNEHTTIPDVLVLGTHVWDNLTEQEQDWLQRAVDDSVDLQRILWQESVEESYRVVQEAGVEIIIPDIEPFREQSRPLYERFRDNNPDLYRWVERIQQVE